MTLAEQQVTFAVLMISGGLGEDCVCVCVWSQQKVISVTSISIKHHQTGFLEI